MKLVLPVVMLALMAASGGCVSVTVNKDMVANDPVDCVDPVKVTSPGSIVVTPVASHPIADAPGKTLTSVLLTVPPGAKSNAHRHSGVAFGYVIEGAVCSQITGDAGLKPYRTGDSFFEPPGSHHLGFINPGIITAKVLVTFVADTGAPMTVPLQ